MCGLRAPVAKVLKYAVVCHLCTNTLCGLRAPVAKVLKYAVVCHLCTNTLCGLRAPVAKVLKYAVHKIEYRFIIIFNVMNIVIVTYLLDDM